LNKTSKILAITGVVLLSIGVTGLLVWERVKKLVQYNLKLKNIKIVTASFTKLKIDVFFNFTNKSDLQIVLSKQEYVFYLNGVYLTTLTSDVDQVIYERSISVLEVNLDLDPKFVLQKVANSTADRLSLLTNFKDQKLKLVTKLWIKFGWFSLPIEIPYEAKIRDWT